MDKLIVLVCDENSEELRIDKYLALNFDGFSRSYIQKLITGGNVTVNGNTVKPSFQIEPKDSIELMLPESVLPEIKAEDIPIEIVYEDDDILIINKPKNMVVHPAAGNYTGTLVNALMFHCKDRLSGINGALRPGIVHRIDKDTTGLLVVCKNDASHRFISKQLESHSIKRRYEAICIGNLKSEEGIIDAPIGRSPKDRKKMAVVYSGGKQAVTHYKVIEHLKGYDHISCVLETGRTHQIRVHMAGIGHPLLGDELYGGVRNGFATEGQCLHAGILGLIHPATGQYMEFSSPLPEYFEKILEKLRCQTPGRNQ